MEITKRTGRHLRRRWLPDNPWPNQAQVWLKATMYLSGNGAYDAESYIPTTLNYSNTFKHITSQYVSGTVASPVTVAHNHVHLLHPGGEIYGTVVGDAITLDYRKWPIDMRTEAVSAYANGAYRVMAVNHLLTIRNFSPHSARVWMRVIRGVSSAYEVVPDSINHTSPPPSAFQLSPNWQMITVPPSLRRGFAEPSPSRLANGSQFIYPSVVNVPIKFKVAAIWKETYWDASPLTPVETGIWRPMTTKGLTLSDASGVALELMGNLDVPVTASALLNADSGVHFSIQYNWLCEFKANPITPQPPPPAPV